MKNILKRLSNQIKNNADAKISEHFKNLNEVLVDKDVQQQRMSICFKCPHFYNLTSMCRMCGCLLKIKTYLPYEKCPIDKWQSVEENKKII